MMIYILINHLASFYERRQITVNFSKTKFVLFGARKSDCKDCVFSGTCCTTVELHDEYRFSGFVFHATKNMAYGVKYLVTLGKA